MGLIGDWLRSKKMKDPVRGTLQVTATSHPPDSATSANFSINGIVSGDGIAPTAVEHAGFAKVRKWPQPGQALPVTVDRADPTRLQIEWDEVEDHWTVARREAEQMAQMMRGGGGGGVTVTDSGSGGVGDVQFTSQTIDASGVPGLSEEVMRLAMSGGSADQIMDTLRAHGVAVPDGGVSFAATASGMPGDGHAADEDPATRLRRLEQLRRDGLITEQEYEAQRTRVLGEL